MEKRSDGLVAEAGRFGRTRQAGEGDRGVWLGDGRAELTKWRVRSSRGKEVMVFHGFEGTEDVASEGTKASRTNEPLGGRTAVRRGVDEGNAGGKEGFAEAWNEVVEADQGERERHKTGGGLTQVSKAESGKAPGACWPWRARQIDRAVGVRNRGPAEEMGSRRPRPPERLGRRAM